MFAIRAPPVCGNLLCETGEQCASDDCSAAPQCRSDCPVPLLTCPVGVVSTTMTAVCSAAGTCVSSIGACNCFTGYTGPACGECQQLYVRVGDKCVFMPGALVSCKDGVKVSLSL